jgi:hypothetical protein
VHAKLKDDDGGGGVCRRNEPATSPRNDGLDVSAIMRRGMLAFVGHRR